MKFTITTAALSLLGLSSSAGAAPQSSPSAFGLLALRSATDIHFARFSAAKSSIFLYLPHQNATCEGEKSDGYATFHIEDEQLFLYSTTGDKQQAFVDRSGMGQGKLGYLTGDQSQSPPPHFELKGWRIDKSGDLYFKDSSLLACPHSIENSWSVWVFSGGTGEPGGNKGCLGMTARTLPDTKPVSCEYTQ